MKRSLSILVGWLVLLLNSCQPLRHSDSQSLSFALTHEDALVVQQCRLSDDSPVADSQSIRMLVSPEAQIFEIRSDTKTALINVVISNAGITAFEFDGLGITGVNVPRAKAESLREIYGLAKRYKHFVPDAEKVVGRNTLGPENTFLNLKGQPVINISLGFDIQNGQLDSSFFWQASTPNVLNPDASGIGVVPHESTRIRVSKPPYKMRFFSDFEQGQVIQQEWYKKDYYPESIEWTLKIKGSEYTRRLECDEPAEVMNRSLATGHRLIVQRINGVMKKNSIVSDIKDISSPILSESTLDHYAQLSGMALVDHNDYDWDKKNFPKIKDQFLRGSLLGVCLRFQSMFEKQIEEAICQDEQIKTIFGRQSTKSKFIESLKFRIKFVIDAYNLSQTLQVIGKGQTKGIEEDYDRLRKEICLDPLGKIFQKYNAESCDRI